MDHIVELLMLARREETYGTNLANEINSLKEKIQERDAEVEDLRHKIFGTPTLIGGLIKACRGSISKFDQGVVAIDTKYAEELELLALREDQFTTHLRNMDRFHSCYLGNLIIVPQGLAWQSYVPFPSNIISLEGRNKGVILTEQGPISSPHSYSSHPSPAVLIDLGIVGIIDASISQSHDSLNNSVHRLFYGTPVGLSNLDYL